MIALLHVQLFPAKTFCWCAASYSVLLTRFSSSFVSLMPSNDSCSSRKAFPPTTFFFFWWYYRQHRPLRAWQLIPAGWFTVTWRHHCQWGVCQRVSFFNVNFDPAPMSAAVNNSVYFICSQVTAGKLKGNSKLTAQFCFFIIITSASWLVWYIFSHEWASIKGDGHS